MRQPLTTILLAGLLLAPRASLGQSPDPTDAEEEKQQTAEQENLLLGGDADEYLDLSVEEISFEDPLVGYVVVTGSKRRERTTSTLPSISVLTHKEVDSLPYFFLGDLLSVLPGVDARWGMMQKYYVGIRGLGSTTSLNTRLLLLWDGVPMNDPFTGGLEAGHFVPLVDVERIEVIRGAGSSMYGANAFSGVVNVVTRDPADLVPLEGVRASALMGSFLTSRIQAAAGQKVGGAHAAASVEAYRTDGPFPHTERLTPNGFDEFKNDDVKSVASQANITYKGLQVRGQFTAGERGKPGTFITDSSGHMRPCSLCHSESEYGRGEKYPATAHSCGNCHASPDDREEVMRGGVAALYDRYLGHGIKLSGQLYNNEYRTNYTSMKEDDFLELREQKAALKQRATGTEEYIAHSSKYNEIVLGTSMRRTEASSQLVRTITGDTSASLLNVAGFAEDELKPTKWLSLSAGGRYDYSTLFGGAFAPRGGLVIHPAERLTVRASASRAFRNPSLSELYVYERRGKYTVQGNTELSREWITSFEAGVNYSFQPRYKTLMRIGGVGYRNTNTDLIGIEAIGRDVATFVNRESATVLGGELEGELELQSSPRLKAIANYAYQRARDEEEMPLPYAPRSKANLTLMLTKDTWGVLLRARVVGNRMDEIGIELPGYATLDASAQFGVGRNMTLQLWANNLTDDQHQEAPGIPRAPLSFFVTVGYTADE